MEYEALLDRALSRLPETALKKERFEIPAWEVTQEGNRTYLKNFAEVCQKLSREPLLLLKFMVSVIGTKGALEERRALLVGNFNTTALQGGLEAFVQEYVMCPACHRPDTRLRREDRALVLKCDACGARHGRKPL
ncbi:MAG: translation initiation factor IF-2 subunit beta [Halobacteria archaeon]